MNTPTTADIQSFANRIQARVDAYYAEHYKHISAPTISVDPKGVKYKRIVSDRGTQCVVVCFVDTQSGDVLKAASWKAPAKHARGNIFSDEGGMEGIDASGGGAVYL